RWRNGDLRRHAACAVVRLADQQGGDASLRDDVRPAAARSAGLWHEGSRWNGSGAVYRSSWMSLCQRSIPLGNTWRRLVVSSRTRWSHIDTRTMISSTRLTLDYWKRGGS